MADELELEPTAAPAAVHAPKRETAKERAEREASERAAREAKLPPRARGERGLRYKLAAAAAKK